MGCLKLDILEKQYKLSSHIVDKKRTKVRNKRRYFIQTHFLGELTSRFSTKNARRYLVFGTTSYRAGRSETEVSLKRYKFCGKERDEETGLYYYGARYYAAWLCRFVNVDSLQFKYPELTSFQYASNNPVSMIDLDGLEGVSFRVLQENKETGELVALKRMIELDVHIGVNKKGTSGAYTPKEADALKSLIPTKYNESNYTDESNLPVEFKFNFKEFDPSKTSLKDIQKNIRESAIETNYAGKDLGECFRSMPGVTMLKDAKIEELGVLIGRTNIKINPDRQGVDFGYAEAHELGHFLLSPFGVTEETPNEIDDHSLGGFMPRPTFVKDSFTGRTIEIQNKDFRLSEDAAQKIIQAVPRVNDRIDK